MSSHREHQAFLFAASLCVAIVAACAGPASTERPESEAEEEERILERYEAQFQPSKYDPPVEVIEHLIRVDSTENDKEGKEGKSTPLEMTQGFRIQVLSTTEIDTANALKAELTFLPEHVGIYVIYDSPYYKVRVGDFLTRLDANPLLKSLLEQGYSDAWIVADRVVKNPPRRSPPSTPKDE